MTKRKLRNSGLGLAVLTLGAIAACSSDNTGTTPPGGAGSGTGGAGTAGSAGVPAAAGTAAGGAAGAATAGGAGTGAGGASPGFACAATAPTSAVITDFSNLVANSTSAGNYTFMGGVLGGTFTYQPNALTLDTVGNTALNIKGNVKAYDGFGLYFNTCYDALTPGYTGVSFSVKGYAGPKGKLNFRVQTNSNTAIDTPNSKGQCVSTAADTYNDCHSASFDIPVTATATVITVNFSQLMGGAPLTGVTGKDVVGLEWAFDWTPGSTGTAGAGAGGASGGSGGASAGAGGASAGSGGASGGSAGKGGSGGASGGSGGASGGSGGAAPAAGPYDADVTIDDVKFLGGPAAGGAAGSGAGGASGGSGGASAGSGGASAGSGGAAAGSGGKGGSN